LERLAEAVDELEDDRRVRDAEGAAAAVAGTEQRPFELTRRSAGVEN
jgi:hypothetical protein